MLKYFALLHCLFYIGFSQLTAQNHLSWEFSYHKLSASIVIKGTIDKGWHLYSQKTPANAGPIPVSISIDKQKGTKLIGKCEEKLEPHEIFDVNFDSQVYLFENTYLAEQKIKIKKTKTQHLKQLNGRVLYMVCDDTRCMPPIEVPFTIQLK
jgi:thiol:disulfide interchange protein DsbD